jgi:hypothetical protein
MRSRAERPRCICPHPLALDMPFRQLSRARPLHPQHDTANIHWASAVRALGVSSESQPARVLPRTLDEQ